MALARASLSSSRHSAFDDELLESDVVGILADFGITVEQRCFLLPEILLRFGTDRTVRRVEAPYVSGLDEQRIRRSAPFPLRYVGKEQPLFCSFRIDPEGVLAAGRGLDLDDVDFLLVLVVDVDVTTVDVAMLLIFEELLTVDVP